MKSRKNAAVSIFAAVILFIIIGSACFKMKEPKTEKSTVSGNDVSENQEIVLQDMETTEDKGTVQIPAKTVMPALTGMDMDAAVRLLNQEHILFMTEWEYAEDAEPLKVLRQSVEEGKEVNTLSDWITITINSREIQEEENPFISMPSFTGCTMDELLYVLEHYSFELGGIETSGINESDVEEGCVTQQYPEAGTLVEPGTEVTFKIYVEE